MTHLLSEPMLLPAVHSWRPGVWYAVHIFILDSDRYPASVDMVASRLPDWPVLLHAFVAGYLRSHLRRVHVY